MSATLAAPSIRTIGAALALDVARRAGVPGRMPFTDPDRRRRPRTAARCATSGRRAGRRGPGCDSGKCPPARRSSSSRVVSAGLDGHRRDAGQPVLEIRRREVMRGIHPLDRMAKHRAVDAQRSASRSSAGTCAAPSPRRRTARRPRARPGRNRPARRGRAPRPHRDHTNFAPGHRPPSSPDRGTSGSSGPRAGWPTYISSPPGHSYLIAGKTGRRTEKPTSTRRFK